MKADDGSVLFMLLMLCILPLLYILYKLLGGGVYLMYANEDELERLREMI